MKLSERFKKFNIRKEIAFNIAYAVFFIATNVICFLVNHSRAPYWPAAVIISAFGYFTYICLRLLRENFITKRHGQTPVLMSLCLLPIAPYIAIEASEYILTFGSLFAYITLSAIVYSVAEAVYNKRFNYIATGVAGASAGLSLYFYMAYFMMEFGGLLILLPSVGAAMLIICLALHFTDFKKSGYTPENLKQDLDGYLESVFKNAPSTERNIALYEELSEKLHLQAEQLKYTGGGYEVYNRCTESLGNFSERIENPKDEGLLTLFTKFNGKFLTIYTLFAACFTLGFTFVTMKSSDYKNQSGSIIGPTLAYAVSLFVMRFIGKIRFKQYKGLGIMFTLAVGLTVTVILWIATERMAYEPWVFWATYIPIAVIGFCAEIIIKIYKPKAKRDGK